MHCNKTYIFNYVYIRNTSQVISTIDFFMLFASTFDEDHQNIIIITLSFIIFTFLIDILVGTYTAYTYYIYNFIADNEMLKI